MKTIKDIYNYWDLPRDGHTFFMTDDEQGRDHFLAMAQEAVYILVPGPYVSLLSKWSDEVNLFQWAPITVENTEGGFLGTVCSVDVFSDVTNLKDKNRLYPAGSPVLFAQWGGAFSHQLETERSPYYAARQNKEKFKVVQGSKWGGAYLFKKYFPSKPERILLPVRFEPDFMAEVAGKPVWHPRREMKDVEASFNGHIGWYKGVPVYTDSMLHPKMRCDQDLIQVHYNVDTFLFDPKE